MKIAIIDDEKREQEIIAKYIGEWAKAKKELVEFFYFDSSEGFLFSWEDAKDYALLVMVDAILNSKLTMIKEKGIQVDATAIVPQDVPFSGIDLSVLIGNLLDNAMEACMQITNKEESFIRIYIDIVKMQFMRVEIQLVRNYFFMSKLI